MNNKLMTDNIHIEKLNSKILALQHECSAKGLLGGSYLKKLKDVLLDDFDVYIDSVYQEKLYDLIQHGSLINIDDFKNFINENVNKLIDNHFQILINGIHRTCGIKDASAEKILNSLSFVPSANARIAKKIAEIGALYTEYKLLQAHKALELELSQDSLNIAREANDISKASLDQSKEANAASHESNEISKLSLNKAEEANRLSKWSNCASWLSVILALFAFAFSLYTFFKKD